MRERDSESGELIGRGIVSRAARVSADDQAFPSHKISRRLRGSPLTRAMIKEPRF